MFAFCEDPSTLSNLPWMACYLTTGKQFLFYGSFLTVLEYPDEMDGVPLDELWWLIVRPIA